MLRKYLWMDAHLMLSFVSYVLPCRALLLDMSWKKRNKFLHYNDTMNKKELREFVRVPVQTAKPEMAGKKVRAYLASQKYTMNDV